MSLHSEGGMVGLTLLLPKLTQLVYNIGFTLFKQVLTILEEQPRLGAEDIQASCPHKRQPCLGEVAFRELSA